MIAAVSVFAMGESVRGADLSIEAFRNEVLQVGRRRFPGMAIEAGPGASDILTSGHHLYVDNIYAAGRSRTAADREAMIVDWLTSFSPAATAKADAIAAASADWAKARPLLRPKMFPQSLVKEATQLIHQPFSPGIVIGYAIDLGDKDLYVSDSRFAPWRVTLAEVHDAALANLEAMSSGVAIDVKRRGQAGGVTFVETGDGYDASRILLPGFRRRMLAALGPVVQAGIPSRDVLIAWSPDVSDPAVLVDDIHRFATSLPHALSDEIFMIDKDGVEAACRPDPTVRGQVDAVPRPAPTDIVMRCDPTPAR